MNHRIAKCISVVAGLGLAAGVAWAANVHFKNGSPTALDGGQTLTVSGALTGLGNGDLLISLNAAADTSTTCTNAGGNQAPGQNPGDITTAGSQSIPASKVKNGNVSFSVTTSAPPQPTAAEAGCPNGNWSAAYTDLAFSTATLTVMQRQGGVFVTVFTKTLTFSPPTDDGPVPAGEIKIS